MNSLPAMFNAHGFPSCLKKAIHNFMQDYGAAGTALVTFEPFHPIDLCPLPPFHLFPLTQEVFWNRLPRCPLCCIPSSFLLYSQKWRLVEDVVTLLLHPLIHCPSNPNPSNTRHQLSLVQYCWAGLWSMYPNLPLEFIFWEHYFGSCYQYLAVEKTPPRIHHIVHPIKLPNSFQVSNHGTRCLSCAKGACIFWRWHR